MDNEFIKLWVHECGSLLAGSAPVDESHKVLLCSHTSSSNCSMEPCISLVCLVFAVYTESWETMPCVYAKSIHSDCSVPAKWNAQIRSIKMPKQQQNIKCPDCKNMYTVVMYTINRDCNCLYGSLSAGSALVEEATPLVAYLFYWKLLCFGLLTFEMYLR